MLSIINLVIWFLLGIYVLSSNVYNEIKFLKLQYGLVWIMLMMQLIVRVLENLIK